MWYPHAEEKKTTGYYFTVYTKINTEQIKELNTRPEIIKIPKRKHRKKMLNISLGNDFFFHVTQKAQVNKSKNKWDYDKLKIFCLGKKKNVVSILNMQRLFFLVIIL